VKSCCEIRAVCLCAALCVGAGYAEGQTLNKSETRVVRQAFGAGRWFPDRPAELKRMVDGFIADAKVILNSIAGRPGPARIFPAMILLLVAGAVVAGGLFFRSRGRGEILWMVLAPATADLIARLVHGEAPDALTTIVLASRARLGMRHVAS
jgi:hypothetical protein